MENKRRQFCIKDKNNTLRLDIDIDKMHKYFYADNEFNYENIKHEFKYK